MEDDSSSEQYIDEYTDGTALITVSEYTNFPYNCIACLTFNSPSPNSQPHGTAFLLSPWLAFTVAHNIYSIESKSINSNLSLSIGFYSSCSEKIKIAKYKFPEGYKAFRNRKDKKTIQYDYALLLLEKPVYRSEYFQLCLNFQNENDIISLFGFGDCQREGNSGELICRQRGSSGEFYSAPCITFAAVHSKRLKHVLGTHPGFSGCPIFLAKDPKLVVAIHKGRTVKEGEEQVFCNIGRLITKQLLEDVYIWAQEMSMSSSNLYSVRHSELQVNQFLEMQKSKIQMQQKFQFSKTREVGSSQLQQFPLFCIGYLQNFHQNGIIGGTGFLISENLVLTLLSSVFTDPKHLERWTNGFQLCRQTIKFYCGSSGCLSEAEGLKVIGIAYCPQHLQVKLNFFDKHCFSYCLLKLERPVIRNRYFKLLVDFTIKQKVYMGGYLFPHNQISEPTKFDFGKSLLKQVTTLLIPQQIQLIPDIKMLRYCADTKIGMLGSPLWIKDGLVIGLHEGKLSTSSSMVGRMITMDLVSHLLVWRQKLEGSNFEVCFYDGKGVSGSKSCKIINEMYIQSRIKQINQTN